MLRIIFLISLLWLGGQLAAQSVAVKKSNNIVVIKGKSYYLHTVEAKETLYSICKAYGVDVEEVRKLNDKKDNALSLYEVLKVPYTEPFVQQDGKYYYHKVEAGETLYSISRRFDIKARQILKNNEQYSHNEPLGIGAVVRLPLSEISSSILSKEKGSKTPAAGAGANAPVQVQRVVLTRQEGKPVKEEKRQEIQQPEKKVETQTSLPVEKIDSSHKDQLPEYLSEVVMPDDPFVKIALLLPFSVKDNIILPDTAGIQRHMAIAPRSEQFLQFYEGFLLAVDSLKNKGYRIDLHVYDTEHEAQKMYEITRELNLLKPDLILGPVYASTYRVVSDELLYKNIPIIYPLSAKTDNIAIRPNFVQVNSSLGTLAAKMADWITGQSGQAKVINISLAGDEEIMPAATEKNLLAYRLSQMPDVTVFRWNVEEYPFETLKLLLSEETENIIVLPTSKEAEVSKILPVLSAYTDRYKITVVGLPEWQTFTSVDHETYYKLNVKLFTNGYVDHLSPMATEFAANFRRFYATEPGPLAYKAYDIGLYFIDLAARFRDRTLDVLEYNVGDGAFSRFRFSREGHGGMENQGFFIVNFSSDYQLKIEAL